MISRKITPRIEHYYNSTKKALLIDGARQVGKLSPSESLEKAISRALLR